MRRLSYATALAVLLGSALPAAARADAVSLSAPHQVRFAAPVKVSGTVSPPAAGEPVQVVNAKGSVVATPTTDAAGHYRTTLRARPGLVLSARWRAVASAPRSVAVLPRLGLRLKTGSILTSADITVHVAPSNGVRVHVVVNAAGRPLYAKRAWVHGGVLKLAVPADATRLTVYVSSEARGGFGATGVHASSGVRVVPLGPGARGEAVAGMKRKLDALHFHQATLEPAWTSDTYDVVLAFQKAFGLPRTGLADRATLLRLAKATALVARVHTKDTHLEVDKTRQILMVVTNGQVTGVIPVSTGATGNTPVGHWHVLWKAPATSTWLGSAILYRTLTFHGGFAIHGYPSVPAYPASHGCVREPIWAADWTYMQTPVGESVYVFA
jgi:lipoprotein-anchoring transpeptidase ErfK/SrfK